MLSNNLSTTYIVCSNTYRNVFCPSVLKILVSDPYLLHSLTHFHTTWLLKMIFLLKRYGHSIGSMPLSHLKGQLFETSFLSIKCLAHWDNVQKARVSHFESRSRSQLLVKYFSLHFVSAPYPPHSLTDIHNLAHMFSSQRRSH